MGIAVDGDHRVCPMGRPRPLLSARFGGYGDAMYSVLIPAAVISIGVLAVALPTLIVVEIAHAVLVRRDRARRTSS